MLVCAAHTHVCVREGTQEPSHASHRYSTRSIPMCPSPVTTNTRIARKSYGRSGSLNR